MKVESVRDGVKWTEGKATAKGLKNANAVAAAAPDDGLTVANVY